MVIHSDPDSRNRSYPGNDDLRKKTHNRGGSEGLTWGVMGGGGVDRPLTRRWLALERNPQGGTVLLWCA